MERNPEVHGESRWHVEIRSFGRYKCVMCRLSDADTVYNYGTVSDATNLINFWFANFFRIRPRLGRIHQCFNLGSPVVPFLTFIAIVNRHFPLLHAPYMLYSPSKFLGRSKWIPSHPVSIKSSKHTRRKHTRRTTMVFTLWRLRHNSVQDWMVLLKCCLILEIWSVYIADTPIIGGNCVYLYHSCGS